MGSKQCSLFFPFSSRFFFLFTFSLVAIFGYNFPFIPGRCLFFGHIFPSIFFLAFSVFSRYTLIHLSHLSVFFSPMPSQRTVGRKYMKSTHRVLGHSLLRSLIHSHRSLIRLLRTAPFARALYYLGKNQRPTFE